MPYKVIPGIYRIKNLLNNKSYIGSSKNIKKRWIRHKRELSGGIHCSKHLQSSWNKNGRTSFEFLILEICFPDKFVEREVYWIKLFRTTEPLFGYNTFLPDDPELYKKSAIRSQSSRKLNNIVCMSLPNNELRVMTIPGIRDELGLKSRKVADVMSYWRGGKGKRSHRGWMFVRAQDYAPDFDYTSFSRSSKGPLILSHI